MSKKIEFTKNSIFGTWYNCSLGGYWSIPSFNYQILCYLKGTMLASGEAHIRSAQKIGKAALE